MEYYFKHCGDHVEIFKEDFSDGPIYTIKDSSCTCPGCVHHKVRCKHLRIYTDMQLHPLWRKDHIMRWDGAACYHPWSIGEPDQSLS